MRDVQEEGIINLTLRSRLKLSRCLRYLKENCITTVLNVGDRSLYIKTDECNRGDLTVQGISKTFYNLK